MKKTKIVLKMAALIVLFAIFFTPIRIIGGLVIGIGTGLGWVARDFRDLNMVFLMLWSDASRKPTKS